MAFTLSNLLQEGYKKLGQYNETTATGGSTSTAVDSKLSGEGSDDDWNRGALFVVRDAGGASAAPEGEFSEISDYTDSTGTFTLRDSVSAAIASGDRFGYTTEFYPLHTMISVANSALAALGDFVQVDTTTLDTATSKTEYTVTQAWKRMPPFRVDYQGRTNDSNDNQWIEVHDFEYVPAAAGSAGLLILPQLVSGRDIRVWYKGVHPYVSAYNDTIYEGFDPELVTLSFVEKALEWQNTRLQGGDRFLLQRLNDARQQLEDRMGAYKPWQPKRKARLFIVGKPHVDPERFKIPGE